MAIAFDSSGSTVGNGVTTLTVDITSAATGAWCYCYIQVGAPQTAVTFTGWTNKVDADDSTFDHYSIWRRQKQSGDTTFAPSWPTSEGSAAGWVSYTGLDGTTPDEQFASVAHTSTANFVTPTATPSTATTWALTFSGARSTVASYTYTPDAALTERIDACNTSNRWSGIELADSNGTVTQAAHTYTAVCSASMSHGATAILFLVPPSAAFIPEPPTVVSVQAMNRAANF
jgi:hypothetical protein